MTVTTTLTGGDVLAESLLANGVDTIFALPGVQLDGAFDALARRRDQLQVLQTRHEQGAAYMAFGYALASGRVGTVLVVPGPGLLNATAALSTANACSAPVLCLTGQIASRDIGKGYGRLHEIPYQLEAMRSVTKWAARAMTHAEIADALQAYWTHVLEPGWWPQARSVLHADIVHRARVLAERGAAGLFADLDHRLHWADGVLTIDRDWGHGDLDVPVDRRGLALLPTCFARGALSAIGPDLTPSITYLSRGQGNLAGPPDPPPAPHALEQLLGAPKARLLTLLHEPTATTELARRLGVTPGAVSQHLAVLHATRLVTRARHGRLVLYARSPLADQLLGL
ncbi:MAG: ArsR family transcriptional regulator [Kitasatospora sp.]|jgi:hypothetical protein|nr:ArsR family transcriptional regulator [Kitasatospora sp.]